MNRPETRGSLNLSSKIFIQTKAHVTQDKRKKRLEKNKRKGKWGKHIHSQGKKGTGVWFSSQTCRRPDKLGKENKAGELRGRRQGCPKRRTEIKTEAGVFFRNGGCLDMGLGVTGDGMGERIGCAANIEKSSGGLSGVGSWGGGCLSPWSRKKWR